MQNILTKAVFSAALTPPVQPPVYDPTFYEMPVNIKRHLFWVDQATGNMFLRYPAIPDVQKMVINQYVASHNIKKEDMLNFWADYVDCLIACHNFEEQASPEFKAWAYGRLCRYFLIDRVSSLKRAA
jgi:hypothetical protein